MTGFFAAVSVVVALIVVVVLAVYASVFGWREARDVVLDLWRSIPSWRRA